MKSIIYIGKDVHKNMYSLCWIILSTGEIIAQTKCVAEVKNVFIFIKSAKKRICEENEVNILTGYEVGCLGFSLYSERAYHDIPCIILVPSTMYGAVKNKKIKNNKMDAFNIATNLMHWLYKIVHIPTDYNNKIKEYIDLRENVIQLWKRIKQRQCTYIKKRNKISEKK